MIRRVIGIYTGTKLFKALELANNRPEKTFSFDGEMWVIEKIWLEEKNQVRVKLVKKGFENKEEVYEY